MNRAIVDEAIARSDKAARKAETFAGVERAVKAGASLFDALRLAGIPDDVAMAAATAVTGLPAAPPLMLRNPQIPDAIDAAVIHDAGGVPLGSLQGRLWIAFADPDAARAAIFADDIVVCLATDDALAAALTAFEAKYPSDDPATLAVPAVSGDTMSSLKRQQGTDQTGNWDESTAQTASRATSVAPQMQARLHGPTSVTRFPVDQDSEEDLFDPVSGVHRKVAPPQPLAALAPPFETEGANLDGAIPEWNSTDLGGPTSVQLMPPGAAATALAAPTNSSTATANASANATANATAPATASSSESESVVADNEAERLRLLRLAALGSLRQFQFERPIGSGSMATVYLAMHKPTGRRVAVKVMQPHLMNQPLAVARFQREVRALRSLDHPHITATLDAGDAEAEANGKGVCWLCCPYLDGGTLAELLRQTGPMPTAMAVPIVGALLEGIAHAHARGVLHRDIKPQNILLSRSGDVQISDFGIARIAGDAPLTRIGFHAGTPAYMAPEQGRGEEVDARSDLFSVGVILVELLRGANPFVRPTLQETLAAVSSADIGSFSSDFPVVTAVVRGLVAADRDARFNSATDVLATLRPLLDQFQAVEAVVAQAIEDPAGAVDAGLDTIGVPGMGSSIPRSMAISPPSVVDVAAAASGFDDGTAPQPIFRAPAPPPLRGAAAPPRAAAVPRPAAARPVAIADPPELVDLPATVAVAVPAPTPTPRPRPIPWQGIAAVVAVVLLIAILVAVFR